MQTTHISCFFWVFLGFSCHGIVVSWCCVCIFGFYFFFLVKTACLVLKKHKKTVFIQQVLKGHIYHVRRTLKTSVHQWLSESDTERAVMLLHIVISDFIVKGSMFILSFCSWVHKEQCKKDRTRQIKAVQTTSLTTCSYV